MFSFCGFWEKYAILSASPTETELYGESALMPQCGLGNRSQALAKFKI